MIITFGTQKGGTGKTTLAIAFANYLVLQGKTVNVFDFDFQRSLFNKWKIDEELGNGPKLYEVEAIDAEEESPFSDEETLLEMRESEEIYIFDLAGTLDAKYIDLLTQSNYVIVPFEYSNFSMHSTLVFINLMGQLEGAAELIFVRSRFELNYNYFNKEAMDEQLSCYGYLVQTPILKRNSLQTINTRKLTYEQKKAVRKTFNEILEYVNK